LNHFQLLKLLKLGGVNTQIYTRKKFIKK